REAHVPEPCDCDPCAKALLREYKERRRWESHLRPRLRELLRGRFATWPRTFSGSWRCPLPLLRLFSFLRIANCRYRSARCRKSTQKHDMSWPEENGYASRQDNHQVRRSRPPRAV